MDKDDTEISTFVEHRSRKMMSFAVYRKLRAVVDVWNREERGKAKVVSGALYGLAIWVALLIASVLVLPGYALLIAAAGFLVWVGFIAGLIRRHLGTPQGRP